jgi:hypothetical protein
MLCQSSFSIKQPWIHPFNGSTPRAKSTGALRRFLQLQPTLSASTISAFSIAPTTICALGVLPLKALSASSPKR